MRGLAEKYAGRSDVAFVIVYQREPHAGRMAFAEIAQPTTLDERRLLAARARDELQLPLLSLVDGMDDASRAWFSDLPAPVFVLDRYGQVAAKQPWIDLEDLPAMIDRALIARPAAASVHAELADALAALIPAATSTASVASSSSRPTESSTAASSRPAASRGVAESRSQAVNAPEAGRVSVADPLGVLRRIGSDMSAPPEDRAAAALAACRRDSPPAFVAAAVTLAQRVFLERPLRLAAALTHAADRLAAEGAASTTVATLRLAAVEAVAPVATHAPDDPFAAIAAAVAAAAGTDPKIVGWLRTQVR